MSIASFKGRSNNLNFIKFIASLLVIFSHSFTVVGEKTGDYLARLTNGQLTFGGFAVAVFFFASGFFVTKSLMSERSSRSYWGKRFIRIYPAFIVMMLATVFILGPCVTTCSLKDYLTSSLTYKYLEYLIFIPRYHLPGVFESNPVSLVNGSLWTLILEMICYLGLFLLFVLKILDSELFKKIISALLLVLIIITFIGKPVLIFRYHDYLRPTCVFAIGCLFYLYRNQIRLNIIAGIVLSALTLLAFLFNYADLAMILFFPYVLSLFVFSKHQVPNSLGKLGDYSYSIYLCGFPVQQLLKHIYSPMSYWVNTIGSVLICFLLAILLYYFVEQPAYRLFRKKLTR